MEVWIRRQEQANQMVVWQKLGAANADMNSPASYWGSLLHYLRGPAEGENYRCSLQGEWLQVFDQV